LTLIASLLLILETTAAIRLHSSSAGQTNPCEIGARFQLLADDSGREARGRRRHRPNAAQLKFTVYNFFKLMH
jgi:hypothetical protein